MTIDITPFTVAIPSSVLEDLKQRIEHARWPEKETCEDWSQGIPLRLHAGAGTVLGDRL